MALFSSGDTAEDTQEDKQPEKTDRSDGVQPQAGQDTNGKPPKRVDNSRANVLIRPYITEKATKLTDQGVYTFVVQEDANKPQIKQAIRDVYSVSVDKVRTAKLPKKQVESRAGKTGTKGGGKKAYVHLKEGDSIELM